MINEDYDLAHKELLEKMGLILKLLYAKKANKVKVLLNEMYNIAAEHFEDEESLMRTIQYPFMDIHVKAHHLILCKIDSIIAAINYTLDLIPLVSALQLMIAEHVEKYDSVLMAYKQCHEEICS